MRKDGVPMARWVVLLVPLALMAGALGSQYIGGLYPCEMCHWQRWPHYAAILVALLSFAMPNRLVTMALIGAAALLIATSGVIGVLHAGVEYQWWPGFTPCAAGAQSGMSGMDIIDLIQKKPIISCDVPQWTLLGVSLAGWNALISLTGALAAFVLLLRGKRA